LRMRHAVVMNYPFKMKDYFAAREKCWCGIGVWVPPNSEISFGISVFHNNLINKIPFLDVMQIR
jgi:hypothetical protein